MESEPTEESSEDFAVVPEIAPLPYDPYVLARWGYPTSAGEELSETDFSSPLESTLPPPSPPETPPVHPSRVCRTARIRTIPVPLPPPHSYMLPTYVPPVSTSTPQNTILEEALPPRKRTYPYAPLSPTISLPCLNHLSSVRKLEPL